MNIIIPTSTQGLTKENKLPSKSNFCNLKTQIFNFRLLLVCLCALVNFNLSSQISMVRLQASGPNNSLDETILYYQLGSSLGFDYDYDAYKISGPNPGLSIAQVYDETNFQINGVEPVSNFLSMPIQVKTPQTGTYTVFATDCGSFPYGTSIILVDKYTGTKTNLKTSNYTFILSDTTESPRFDLNISYMNMPIVEQTIFANCVNPIDNYIVKGTGAGPWNYIWKDGNENIIKTKFSTMEEDSFNLNLTGTYKVHIESTDGFDCNTSQFTINTIELPIASFTTIDTFYIDSISVFTPINNSINATSYQWNFGDTNQTTYDTNNTYNYVDEGEYLITLIAFNSIGCSDTTTSLINVLHPALPGNNIGNNELFLNKTYSANWTQVEQNVFLLSTKESEELNVTIYDLNGRVISNKKIQQASTTYDLNYFATGIYFLEISSKQLTKKCAFRIF